jgi:hypothetical protein
MPVTLSVPRSSPKLPDNHEVALMEFLVFAFFIYVFVCHRIAVAAERKGRSYVAWLAIALLTSPILAGIIVASMAATQPAVGGELSPCPRCAEPIRAQAQVCRFCGQELAAADGDGVATALD